MKQTLSAPPRASEKQLDVWTQPALPSAPAGAPTSPPREQLEKQLVTIAKECARKAGAHGCTVADIRIFAQQRGLLTGEEAGRALSWLYQIPKKAGLVATGQVRPSTLPRAHGNFQRVHVLPDFRPEGGK